MRKREVPIGPATIGIGFAVFGGALLGFPYSGVIYLLIAFYLMMLAE